MGHIWLGELPRTGYWPEVINALGLSCDPQKIATVTAKAAHKGLDLAKRDSGVANVIFVLMKTVWSSIHSNFQEALGDIGITLTPQSDLLDVIGEMDRILDNQDFTDQCRFSLIIMRFTSL